jgi:hypothetical protein
MFILSEFIPHLEEIWWQAWGRDLVPGKNMCGKTKNKF